MNRYAFKSSMNFVEFQFCFAQFNEKTLRTFLPFSYSQWGESIYEFHLNYFALKFSRDVFSNYLGFNPNNLEMES